MIVSITVYESIPLKPGVIFAKVRSPEAVEETGNIGRHRSYSYSLEVGIVIK